jgi:hypothetical protein
VPVCAYTFIHSYTLINILLILRRTSFETVHMMALAHIQYSRYVTMYCRSMSTQI